MLCGATGRGIARAMCAHSLERARTRGFRAMQFNCVISTNERAVRRPSKFSGEGMARAFIRVERQTLRKLPATGDILFTIRIHLDPLKVLARHPDRATLAASFAAQLEALDEAQLDYKGLTADRDRLVAFLASMAMAA